MKRFIIGFVLAAVCVGGVSVMAETNDGKSSQKGIEVRPTNEGNIVSASGEVTNANVNDTVVSGASKSVNIGNEELNNKKVEIENYIKATYGDDWGNSLRTKNGDNWDDILEKEIEKQFGHRYEELIEDIIDTKEREVNINNNIVDDDDNDLDDIFDNDHDDNDDWDDVLDDKDHDDDHDDLYDDNDDHDDDNDLDDIFDNDDNDD